MKIPISARLRGQSAQICLPVLGFCLLTVAAAGAQQTATTAEPLQVLLVTKGHGFDRAPFFEMFDELGPEIVVTHVEQPAAQLFWDPANAAAYDAFVYYDAMGRGAGVTRPDGSIAFDEPSDEAKRDLEALLKQGKGMVFLHHSIAAWNQSWPAYAEIVGGACDWGNRVHVRGKEYPFSGAQAGVTQRITVVDRSHPIVQGLGDGFEIVDETYLCPYFEDSFTPLLTTDFVAIPENFPGRYNRDAEYLARSNFRNSPPGSNVVAWVKTAENSPIVYLQNGHDAQAWSNEAFTRLLRNAIEWAASEEARSWARANPSRIF